MALSPQSRTPRVLVIVPTYNESQNIRDLVGEILRHGPAYHVLVVDDHSPDGTWKIAQELARADARVHVLHRETDKGRGYAGRAGFCWGLERGYEVLVEMDADFSHPPRYLPVMVERLLRDGASSAASPVGLVLGSRGVSGGSDADRGPLRRAITVLANLYIRIALGLAVRDCNSGYRAWTAGALRAVGIERAFSAGPSIVQELLYKAARARVGVAEIGIEFVDRKRGTSTLNMRILLRGYVTVLKLRWLAITGRL
jgi:dolichol-phosphate mannosyltransferase